MATSASRSSSPVLSSRQFSVGERRALRALRADYRGQEELFTARELSRLRFLRWLWQSGRLSDLA